MIVVDTNIICGLYLPTQHLPEIVNLQKKDPDWVAPSLWISEFRNVITKYLRNDLIQYPAALLIIEDAQNLMRSMTYQVNSLQVMDHVQHSDCSSYDCEFIALADDMNLPLLTYDKKMIRAFPDIARHPKDYLKL